MCAETKTLLGSTSPHQISYVFLAACILSSLAAKIAGLVLAIIYQHKLIAAVYPAEDISKQLDYEGCDWVTVMGEKAMEVYQRKSLVYEQVDGQGKLMFTMKGWRVWSSSGDLISIDTPHMQWRNKSYDYYCEDLTVKFPFHWLPIITWILFFLLPPFIFSFLALLLTFRLECCKIIRSFPFYIFCSALSYITLGPVKFGVKNPTHFSVSRWFTSINVFFNSAAVVTLLIFITPRSQSLFDAIFPSLILLPLFLFSSVLTMFFILIYACPKCCKCASSNEASSQKLLIWRTTDPTQSDVVLYITV